MSVTIDLSESVVEDVTFEDISELYNDSFSIQCDDVQVVMNYELAERLFNEMKDFFIVDSEELSND